MTAADLATRLDAKRNGAGWQAKCPAHDDDTPSLSLSEGREGVLLHCHAGCSVEAVCAALGIEMRELFADGTPSKTILATYDYPDESGTLLSQVVRFAPKDFRQRKPDGMGGWEWNLNGVRRVLYRLPELVAGVAAGKRVWITEGEKDAEALRSRGLVATTNSGGAGKWRPEYSVALKGADVVIVRDKDEPGRAHARDVAKALRGIAAKVVTVEPATGKDVSDHLAAGRKLGELVPVPLDAPSPAVPLTPWGHACSAPEFLATVEPDVAFLKPRLLVAGGVTFLFSPRGLGKTHIGHAIAVELAREGLRVLLMDRDNPDREFHRRLQGWAAEMAPSLKVMSRRHAPALTDTVAWASFPVTDYDVLILDSLDSFTEGVGEQDSSRVSRALATLLDIVRRPDGPAVLIPGNTVKSAAHSRGSGVVEDRADIVYEVRDATDLKPTGTKAWWEELAPAGAEAWAQRAGRRKRRDSYRLALIPSKFRVGSEPDPFVLEVNLGEAPWTLKDVTDELVRAGESAVVEAAAATREQQDTAATALREAIAGGATLNRTEAVALLMDQELTQKEARALLAEREWQDWRTELRPDLPGKPRVLTSVAREAGGIGKAATEIPPRDNADATTGSDGGFRLPLETLAQRKCPEITQAPQGVSGGGISVAPDLSPRVCPNTSRDTLPLTDSLPPRLCCKGHPETHRVGFPADMGWVCQTCSPAAYAVFWPGAPVPDSTLGAAR